MIKLNKCPLIGSEILTEMEKYLDLKQKTTEQHLTQTTLTMNPQVKVIGHGWVTGITNETNC